MRRSSRSRTGYGFVTVVKRGEINGLTRIDTTIALLIHDGGDVGLCSSECSKDGVGGKGFSVDIDDAKRQVCGRDQVVRGVVGV